MEPISKRGFTVLELMVGILIFTIGMIGAYLLIQSANEVSIRSRDEIIGANIMREQVELTKNMRDTNWINLKKWNSIETGKDSSESDMTMESGYYTIENHYSDQKWISLKKLRGFTAGKDANLAAMKSGDPDISLCIDSLNRYTHSCSAENKRTSFASYLLIEPLETADSSGKKIFVDRAYRITAFFVTTDKGYREYSMNTILTDWKK